MRLAWQDVAGTDVMLWVAAFAAFFLLTLGVTVWLRRPRRRVTRWRRRR